MREVVYKFADGTETYSYEEAKAFGNYETEIREVITPYKPDPLLQRIISKRFPQFAD